MVSKTKKENIDKKKKIKLLNLKKESVKDLTSTDAKGVKGGLIGLSLVGKESAVRSRHTLRSRY